MTGPTLALISNFPRAVRRTVLVPGHTCRWMLRATFPTPHDTVFLRYSKYSKSEQDRSVVDALDILLPSGKLLQGAEQT
jgi:hypothetical protein